MKVIVGALGALLVLALAAFIYVITGSFPLAASSDWDAMDTGANWMKTRTIPVKARQILDVPGLAAKDAAAQGLRHYRDDCLACHGAPDVPPAELSQGLNPAPPAIEVDRVQRYSDRELFWIVKNGIRMTGMPAFGLTQSDEEIGHIVAFLRKVPRLTDAEKELLRQGHGADAPAPPGGAAEEPPANERGARPAEQHQ